MREFIKKPKMIIVIFGIVLILISFLWYKTWYILLALLTYGSMVLLSGINYRNNKKWFWCSVFMTAPWAGLIYYQFFRRVFYWFVHGGEFSGVMGSPMAFLIGWLFELPLTLGISIVCYVLYKDLLLEMRNSNFSAIEKSVQGQ